MKREFDADLPEQMDIAPEPSPELREDLRNLEKLNRWFGSHDLILHFCRRWFEPGKNYRLIDLATGYGDIPRLIIRWARTHDIGLEIEARDFSPATLTIAREESSAYPEIRYDEGDVRSWVPESPADVVFFSLALHHFSDQEAAAILARLGSSGVPRVLVSDLRRSRLLQIGVWLLTTFVMRNPMTRHDARLSVRRSFSARELRELAARAGWRHAKHQNFPSFRQALWQEQSSAGRS